jgi:hypothetical protein
MTIDKIYIGGWFQRTTLHLTEIWDFFKNAKTTLEFSEADIKKFQSSLGITTITRESGPLEYIAARTLYGIDFRIYEDGLIILEKKFTVLEGDFTSIREYYDGVLSKAISFIFSKGAPVPKELANIKTILPFIVTVKGGTSEELEKLFKNADQEIYAKIETKNVKVFRGPGLIIIDNLEDESLAREIIESQIFFREFKAQLHRYLAIHRSIWEKIQKIKEDKTIKGTNIDKLRNELSVYQKTINLIGARIDQMPAYVKTRQKMTDLKKIDAYLEPLFQSKFETLLDTHEYIKHLWTMTKNYLGSTIELFTELQAKSTKNSLSSLQLITTIGVVAAILGYLTKDVWPKFTFVGLAYFAILLVITWLLNSGISRIFKNKSYTIKSDDIGKGI